VAASVPDGAAMVPARLWQSASDKKSRGRGGARGAEREEGEAGKKSERRWRSVLLKRHGGGGPRLVTAAACGRHRPDSAGAGGMRAAIQNRCVGVAATWGLGNSAGRRRLDLFRIQIQTYFKSNSNHYKFG
jgi:hypothetical protein